MRVIGIFGSWGHSRVVTAELGDAACRTFADMCGAARASYGSTPIGAVLYFASGTVRPAPSADEYDRIVAEHSVAQAASLEFASCPPAVHERMAAVLGEAAAAAAQHAAARAQTAKARGSSGDSDDEWELLEAEDSAGAGPAAPVGATPAPEPPILRGSLQFTVNGKAITVDSPSPTARLSSFLRDELHLRGTKVGCGEGGCGACTVVVSTVDPGSGAVVHRPINACLRLLCSCDGLAITTVEGIGSHRAGFHPVQSRLAAGNGTQVGARAREPRGSAGDTWADGDAPSARTTYRSTD